MENIGLKQRRRCLQCGWMRKNKDWQMNDSAGGIESKTEEEMRSVWMDEKE